MKKASFLSLLAVLIMAVTSCTKGSSSSTTVTPQSTRTTYHGMGALMTDDIILQNGYLSYGYRTYKYSTNGKSITVASTSGGNVGTLTVSGNTLINNCPSIFNSKYYVLY